MHKYLFVKKINKINQLFFYSIYIYIYMYIKYTINIFNSFTKIAFLIQCMFKFFYLDNYIVKYRAILN